MFAIAFDMVISELKTHYGTPYHRAYSEIKKVLKDKDFYWIQGSTYATQKDLTAVYRAIDSLNKIDWFRKSVRDIRVFRIEDWSDFTQVFKE